MRQPFCQQGEKSREYNKEEDRLEETRLNQGKSCFVQGVLMRLFELFFVDNTLEGIGDLITRFSYMIGIDFVYRQIR